jgi:heme/copper-type cytochrome/quinol oxidase subunit 3
MKIKLLASCLGASLLFPTPALYTSGYGAGYGARGMRTKQRSLIESVLTVAGMTFIAYYIYTKYYKHQHHKHECCKHNG